MQQPQFFFIESYVVIFLQTNFQAILATDERITFAIFLYGEDIDIFLFQTEPDQFTAGFDAGDGRRGLTVPLGLQEAIYRIDGLLFFLVMWHFNSLIKEECLRDSIIPREVEKRESRVPQNAYCFLRSSESFKVQAE